MAATTTISRIPSNGKATAKEESTAKNSAKKKKSIEIPALRIQTARIKVVGLSDLIVKRMSEKTQQALVGKQAKSARGVKEARDPEAEFADSLYLMPGSKPAGTKGAEYGFPASGIKKAVVTAAGRFLKDGLTLNGKVVAGSLFVVPTTGSDLVKIIHGPNDPYMRSDQGRNPNSSGAVVIHRGAFEKWSMEFLIRFNSGVLSIDQVVELFMWAGFSVGIGEWRPEKSGSYGQFEVVTK